MKLNKILKVGAALGAAFALTSAASAGFISGGISLGGGYATNTGNLNTATTFTSFTAISTGGTGNFSPVTLGTAVTQTGFTFNPLPSGGVTNLWTVTIGATTYAFDLSSPISIIQPGDNTLTLKGTGKLKITGFTNTPGTWVFTANQAGGSFSFSSSNGAVPDGGTTVALLGLSLLGLHGARRKFSKN